MKFYFKIHFETFIIFILFLQGLKVLSWKSYILSEMSLLSCDKVSCSGAGSVGVGGCLLSRSWGETTTSSLFTWYYWSLRGWSRPTISLVLLSSLLGRNNLHTLSLFDCPREKTEENINQAVSWELRVVTWCLGSRLFHFLPESRPAVGGKNIFLKLPHINIRSTAANMGTEWNLFIHVKHRIST